MRRADHLSRVVLPSFVSPMSVSQGLVRGGHAPKCGRSSTTKNLVWSDIMHTVTTAFDRGK
jgi:hypothetical protein